MFNKRGQMLVEVLVAMGVGTIILAAVVSLFIDVQKGGILNNQRTRANNLVQEGLEAARSVRYANWSGVSTNGTYHPVINSFNAWELQPGPESGIDGLFSRRIEISSVYRIANPADPAFMQIVPASTPGAVEDRSTKQVTVTVSWNTPVPQTISQKIYLSRYLNNNLFTQTTQTDFNAGVLNNTQVVAAPPPPPDNGSVILASGAGPPSFFGNQFLVESTSGMGRLNASNLRSSLRFTAQATKTVSRIRVYLHEEVGTSPTYRYGIQADSGGNPSGTYLGYGDYRATTTGWQEITLNTGVALTAGQVYHLVVQWQSGTINNNNCINLRLTAPLNLLYPYNNAADSNANTLWYNGVSWSAQNFQPLYVLRFSDNTYEGNPYITSAQQTIYGNLCHGEEFTVSGSDKTVTAISFYVARRNVANLPQDNLYVRLYDVTGGSLIEQGILTTPGDTPTTFTWKTYTFTTPRTLQNGRTYRIYLVSPLTTSARYYLVYRIENTNAPEYNSINYDGTSSRYIYSSNGGSSFTAYDYYDIGGYRFTVPGSSGYVPSGTFTSSVIDAGSEVAFNTIDFDGNIPAATALNLQIATSTSPTGPWNFVGPDGTSGTYYTLTSVKAIHLNHIIGRYIRYQASLSTSNSAVTPSLDAVYINYSP